jgi:N-acetylmuramoyl-L-alanine amidase
LIIGLFATVLILGLGYVIWLSVGAPDGAPTEGAPLTEMAATPKPSDSPRPTRTPRPTKTPKIEASPTATVIPRKVGIVVGHWKSDSGAVCPDGLQEVTINLDVASRVVALLQSQGHDAELLAEFSEKLTGYKADAFVSIHADACGTGATGFKVARLSASAIPDEEDRLVECLVQAYGEETGLSFHARSITFDMTDYHAFWEIDPATPGVIIELGFMDGDRKLLTQNSYKAAQGVAKGIACFLNSE